MSGDNLTCGFTDSDSFDLGIFDINIAFVAIKISVGITTGLGFTVKMISGTSERDEWSILHMMQQLVMLPLMAKFMTQQVRQFIVSNAFTSLSIYSVPTDWIKSIFFIEDLSYEQFNEYFEMLEWESGSTLVSNILLIVSMLIIVFLHLLIWILRRLTKNSREWLHGIFCKLFDFFTFSVYIRIFYEIYFFALLMAVSEINYYEKAVKGYYISEYYWYAVEGNKNSVFCAYII